MARQPARRDAGASNGWRPIGLLRHAPVRWLVRVGVPALSAAYGAAFLDGWFGAVSLALVSAIFVVAAVRRATTSGNVAAPRPGTVQPAVEQPVTVALRAVRCIGAVAAAGGGALWVWTLTGLTPQVERLGEDARDFAHLGVQEMREAAILIVVTGVVALTKGAWLPALPLGVLLLTADAVALFTAWMIVAMPLAAAVRWRVSGRRILPLLSPPVVPPFDPFDPFAPEPESPGRGAA